MKRNPDTIAALVTGRGYICWAWVHEGYEGPRLTGHHVIEFLQLGEAVKVMAWVQMTLKKRLPITGYIELDMEAGIKLKRRKVRLLPFTKNVILCYVVRNPP